MTAFVQMLLVLLLQSTALLLLGLLALHLTRRRGLAVQSLVGRASLVSVALLVLLLPLTGHVPPVVRVPEPVPQQATLPEREGAEVRAKTVGALLAAPSDTAAPFPQNGQTREEGQTQTEEGQTRGSAPTPRPPAPGEPLRSNLLRSQEIGSLWLAVTAALLLWLAVCQWHLTRLRRTAEAITTGFAVALLAELTLNPPRLLTHPSVHSPFLAGYNRPVIFLPPTYAADFNADALRAIFVHELAHRDRRDNSWTLAARLLTALLWPQPLLWLLVRRLEHSSEDACDEAVLAQNCPPRAYADCLLSLASRSPLRRSQRTLNAGVAPFRSSVGRRISCILLTKGVPPMSLITLRLRLSIAALTVAAVTGGAFLVSSAPAQQVEPKYASVVGIWKMRTMATTSGREFPYQNIYRFNSNKTGLYRIDIGKGPGRPEDHPEFHVACPFTWSEVADTIIINLPSGGADRVNEQQTGFLSSDGQVLHITKRQWQDKLWSGSSWKLSEMRTVSDDLRVFRQSAQPETSSDTVGFVPENAHIHAALNHGTTGMQITSMPAPDSLKHQIVGRIVYENGQPTPGVIVDARLTSNSVAALTRRGQKVQDVKMGAEATTQADGSYRLSDLTAGCSYDIIEREASGEWVARAVENVPLSKTTTHAPTLILTHGAVVTGTVINKKTGQPMPEMSVLSLGPRYPASMGGSSSTRTDAAGKYSLRIVPGDNWIYISGTDANANYVTGQIGVSPLSTNLKYPQYEHGFHVVITKGETKVVPIYAILPATPAHL